MSCGARVLPSTVSAPSEVVHHAGGPQLEQIHLVNGPKKRTDFLANLHASI